MKTMYFLHLLLLTLALSVGPSVEARERGPVAPKPRPGDTVPTASQKIVRPAEIRLIYYSGDVTVTDTAGVLPVAFGMLLDSTQNVVVGRGGSAQLAVDGRVVVLERTGRFGRTEIMRRVTGDRNEELMAALRALEAHSDFTSSTVVSPARLQAAVAAAIAPSARSQAASSTGMLVALEPRSTAVTRGPIRFRWLNDGSGATYRIVVRDRFDQEVLRHETADTSFVWESAVLFAGSEYSWHLARIGDTASAVTSRFHRLDDLRGMRLEGGESRIRLALGSENPALPILLGAHFAVHGCYADAARQFTTAALKTPEHFDRILRLARDQYERNIGLSATELEYVQTLGAITMN